MAPARKKRSRKGQLGDDHDENDAVQFLSMGFGKVEFGSHESARKALKLLNGEIVDGHSLELKPSNRGNDQSAANRKSMMSGKNFSKLLVRNVTFEATRQGLLHLFDSFGQLKKVQLPKKFDGTNCGFAFVEYLTGKEAAAAMKALSRAHFYGRHLVIEWAASDEEQETAHLQGLREKAGRDVTWLPGRGSTQEQKIRFT